MTRTCLPALRARDLSLPAAILAAAGALWVAFRLHTGMTLEDALITFRYADNLASGRGFAFNPGEPVLGTTTPLLTLLLAAAARLFGPAAIPHAAFALSFGASLATGGCLWWLLRRWGVSPAIAALALGAWAAHPTTLWTVAGGMETPLVVLFMTAGAAAVAAGRPWAAGLACGLLVLTRIDGLLFAGLLGALLLWRDPRAALRAGALALAVLLPWLVYATATFGSPLPHSVAAKATIGQERHAYRVVDVPALRAWLDWSAGYWAAAFPLWRPAGVLLLAGGAARVARRRELREGPALAVAACTLLLPICFYLGHAPRFEWYLVPIVWGSVALSALAAQGLVPALLRGPVVARAAGGLLALALAVGLGWQDLGTATRERLRQENEDGARRAVGEWLRSHTASDASVAMEAIGYQGTHAHRRVIDLAGLVSPEVVAIARRDPDNARRFHDVLAELQPDYLVLRSFEVDENRHFHGGPLLATPEQAAFFHARYAEAARFEAPHPELWGSRSRLTVYEKRANGLAQAPARTTE